MRKENPLWEHLGILPGLGTAQRNILELVVLKTTLLLRLQLGPEALSSRPLPVVRIVSHCLIEHFEEEGTQKGMLRSLISFHLLEANIIL